MRHSSNLRIRLALFVLLPGTLCALCVGIYLAYAVVRDVSRLEHKMGDAYGEQISKLAFNALQAGDSQRLQDIAQLALEYPLVRSVSFHDASQRVLAHAGPRHADVPADAENPFSTNTVQRESGNARQLFIPVRHPRLNVSPMATSDPVDGNDADTTVPGWVQIEYSDNFLTLYKYRTIFIDTVIVAIVLAIAFWLVMPFSDRLASTLRQLTQSARAISHGNTSIIPPESNILELQELGEAITGMRTAIVEQQTGLQQHIDQSMHDLRETLETIEIQNIELDLARREAVQASRVKSEFLANTSHEIRTPLNSIIGFSKLLLKTPLTNQQQDYLQNIRKSSENLLTIINDVLDLSKIEAGKLVLDYAAFDLNETLEEILLILAPGAHEKGLELLHMIYSDVPRFLLGDPLRLKQVLTNLISNAIKFSDQGNIVVRVSAENIDKQQALLKIEVTDSGKGLPNNNQLIFNAFTQLDSSSTREYTGTGLGLAISQKIVQQMSGDIGYNSRPGNTTFWFTVRFDIADRPQTGNELMALPGRHVLVYEKEPLCRLAMSHSLTAWGIQPLLADNIAQVIPALERHAGTEQAIDAAILGLPVRHSPQELEQLLQSIDVLQSRYRCPVVLCISTSARHTLMETLRSEIETLPKPVTENRLHTSLCHALQLDTGNTSTQLQDSAATTDTPSLNVLAVDDNPSNLKLISTMLSDLGTRVFEADNGQEALRLFQEKPIDIVFMDIQMPVMDGIEATQKIRQLEGMTGKHTPIIALTAHALAEQRQHLLMSGLDDYLSKPASEQQLAGMMAKWHRKADISFPVKQRGRSTVYSVDDYRDSCIDRTAALRASGDRAEIATEMLEMLLATLDSDRNTINAMIEAGNLEKACEHIHKLHGASCYCGVTELRNCCNAMETLIRKEMADHLPDVLQPFNKAVDKLVAWRQSNTPAAFFGTGKT